MTPKPKKGAFDPSRLEDDLDDLLPPVPLKLVPAPSAAPSDTPAEPQPEARTSVAPAEPASTTPHDDQPPPRTAAKATRVSKSKVPVVRQVPAAGETAEAASVVVAAARLPQDLYDDLTAFLSRAPERPSYAQLISWTCQDRPAAVVEDLLLSAVPSARVPRGRAKASPFALVTPRFLPDEIGFVDAVQQLASEQLGRPVNRTQVICAAIRTAIQ